MPPAHDLPIPLLIAIALVLGFFLFVSIFLKIRTFRKELTYINKELRRNTGASRKYWLEQRKKLWLSLLPFRRK